MTKPDWECTIEERPYRDFIPIAVTGRCWVSPLMTAADLGIVPLTRWSNFAFAQHQIMRAHRKPSVDQNLDDKIGMELTGIHGEWSEDQLDYPQQHAKRGFGRRPWPKIGMEP